jgi:uncharacterized membrane protein YphA (DoxX/SURF4 family)
MSDQTPPGTPMPDVLWIIRHVLTTAGGALVAAGYLTPRLQVPWQLSSVSCGP